MIKFNKYLVASIATLMCLSPVFAADTSTDDHSTNLNYTVEQSYKWTAPADITFATNIDTETKSGTVTVIENIIAGNETLKISIDSNAVFQIESAEHSIRNYKVLKDSDELSAGSLVLEVPSGTNEATQDLNFVLQGVVKDNTSQVAGAYTGTLNFVANIETTGSTVSVTKGQIVTMSQLGLTDVDANNDSVTDTFRVLSTDGTNVKLLAMDSYKDAYFDISGISTYAPTPEPTGTDTYAGSTLDTEMTNYYNALPANIQSAIVAQDIVQSVYSYSNPMSTANRSSERTVGERYVYALDVDDLISYLGDSYTAIALNQMFFGDDVGASVSRLVWLRSARAGHALSAFGVSGVGGSVGSISVDGQCEVRPAFVLNLG